MDTSILAGHTVTIKYLSGPVSSTVSTPPKKGKHGKGGDLSSSSSSSLSSNSSKSSKVSQGVEGELKKLVASGHSCSSSNSLQSCSQ